MPEIELIVGPEACVERCLKHDGSDLLILSATLFMLAPGPDLVKLRPDGDVLQRLVPFEFVVFVFTFTNQVGIRNVVQFVRDLCFRFRDVRTIGVLTARVADSCRKGPLFSLN